DDGRSVAAHLKLEAPARELGGRRIGEQLRGIGAVGEAGGSVHHLADRAGEVDLAATAGDAHLAALAREKAAQLERARGFAAERPTRSHVRDDGILPEGDGIGAAALELLDDLGAPFAVAHPKRDDRREQPRAPGRYRGLWG